MKSNATTIYSLCLVIVDFVALVAAFIGGFVIRGPLSSVPVANPIHATTYIGVFLTLLPFWILIFALLGLYNSDIFERRFVEIGRLLIGSFIGLMFVIFWNFLKVQPIFPSKLVPIYGFLIGFVLVVVLRNIARLIRGILFRYKIGLTKVLVVGKDNVVNELVSELAISSKSGYQIVGIVGAKSVAESIGVPSFKNFDEFISTQSNKPDGIIQAKLYAHESRNRQILDYAQENHVDYRFIPGNSELFVGNLDVELFQHTLPIISVRQTALFGWGRIVKRAFDVLVSALLIIILSPILLIIYVLLALAGGHPIYRRKRLTRFGNDFVIYKFRSIKNEYNGLDPEEGFAKMGRPDLAKQFRANGDYLENDPRVSRFGNFLRKTSLDELPQLLNILKGDISLVGPRALIAEEITQHEKSHTILEVKSGLTGLAQVSGRKNISFDERRRLDLYYVQNWSFWLDITILIKTIRVVVNREKV